MAHKRNAKSSANAKKPLKSAKTTKPATSSASNMTMCTAPLVAPRSPMRERRTERRVATGKRLAMSRAFPGKIRSGNRRSVDRCDNSNDSGLGYDNHVDHHANITERLAWTSERAEAKRPRLDIKLEDDEVNENFSFPETIRTCKETISIIRSAPSGASASLTIQGAQTSTGGRTASRCTPIGNRPSFSQPITLASQLSTIAQQCNVGLKIITQPEQQHRARYQTEGSRGAVKDRSGNGFPVVQLTGYQKPAILQIFIGTDVGKVSPHMFYQACRVSGKNSTPCTETKQDGTVIIELQLDPSKDMIATCDCVGILKERNVDVEHRFPDQVGSRSKKKSTRCRMVFRTTLTHDNGMEETLQVCSQPIVCTQPPGIPEICKKSLSSCPATGGLELFILGKNFLKDTKVYFQQADEQGLRWEQFVIPDKEFLQQTHLVCIIPPYARSDITESVTVRVLVVSSGKSSEPHQFVYTPTSGAMSSVRVDSVQPSTFMNKTVWSSMNKHEQGIMPPPGTNQMPTSQRRSSINIISDAHSPPLHSLKQELMDENSQNSIVDSLEVRRERFRNISESSLDAQQGDSNLTMINESSMDMIHHNSVSLDAISHENSMNSLSETEMEMMVRRNSVSQNSMDVSNSGLTTNTNVSGIGNVPISDVCIAPDLATTMVRESVMDLRMKMPPATVADLAYTNAPSLATLQSFGVTEPTNIPLPAQTAQSIESYLSTIETKSVTVDSMGMPRSGNTGLHLTQLLTPIQQSVLTTTTQSLNHLSAITSHISGPLPSFNDTNRGLLAAVRGNEEQSLLCHRNELLNDKNVQIQMERGMNNNEREVHSPQDILISNKPSLNSQDMLLNSTTQPLMILPTQNLESAEVNVASSSSNISPDIILNSQISPSMMCRNEGLLSAISVTTDTNLIAIPETSQQSQLLTSRTPSPTTLSSVHSPVGVGLTSQITTVITTTEPEKAILFKAAVDLLQTQQKISELESLAGANGMEQVLMNDILSTSPGSHKSQSQQQLSSTVNGLQQVSMISSTKSLVDNIVPVNVVKDISIQSEKKNEDLMIPTSFATMSETDLINIINPSCFDQV